MNSRTFQLFWGLTQQIETNQKAVALTFDDGPTDNTNQILQLLKEYNAKATFFSDWCRYRKISRGNKKNCKIRTSIWQSHVFP